MIRRPARARTMLGALLYIGTLALGGGYAAAAPYCLLMKPFSPPQGNCFQFYLADTAVTPPATMAVPGATGCEVTDYAARQGWSVDATVPGPHATSGEGDAAMSVVSPYFGDAYGCRAPTDGNSASTGGGMTGGSGTGCVEAQAMSQPEQRDAAGAITVEASIIHVLSCPDGRQVYLYEYLNRPGFRVINPPEWGAPVGGRDFGSMDEALVVASTGTAPEPIASPPDGPVVAGDQPPQAGDAYLTWMWQFRAFVFNGQFTGSTTTGWTFAGEAADPGVVGSVSCTGGPANVEGIEAGGGGQMTCSAQFPPSADAGASTWQGQGQGRIDWDGFLLKAGGKGVIMNADGPYESSIEVFHLKAGHVPTN